MLTCHLLTLSGTWAQAQAARTLLQRPDSFERLLPPPEDLFDMPRTEQITQAVQVAAGTLSLEDAAALHGHLEDPHGQTYTAQEWIDAVGSRVRQYGCATRRDWGIQHYGGYPINVGVLNSGQLYFETTSGPAGGGLLLISQMFPELELDLLSWTRDTAQATQTTFHRGGILSTSVPPLQRTQDLCTTAFWASFEPAPRPQMLVTA